MFFENLFATLSIYQWILFASCSFLIGMAKGGVPGVSMISIPIFAAIFGGKMGTGIMLPILLVADTLAVLHYYKFVEWKYIVKILPSAIAGILIALWIGNIVDDGIFKAIMAIVIFLCVILMVIKGKTSEMFNFNSPIFSMGFGVMGGFAAMIGNAVGPIFSIYLLATNLPKKAFIATAAMFYFMLNIIKLPLHIFVWKSISISSISMNILVVPVIVVGGIFGIWVSKHIPESTYRWFVIVTIIFAAILMLL